MAVTYTANGGITTVKHEFKGATTKLKKAYNSASHYLFDHGKGDHGTEESPIVFDDLTDQDKADIVHAHLMQVVKDAAKTYLITNAKDTAHTTGETEYTDTTELLEV